ncbi:MAG: hypothetical protein M5U34_36740 [Chloroflexi bacterium]|nr:hypothetical protein [Chloroflexota bacterium]
MRKIVLKTTPWLPDDMVPELYESLNFVPQISSPTLLLHGRSDMLVPLAHGEQIHAALTAPKIPAYHRRRRPQQSDRIS